MFANLGVFEIIIVGAVIFLLFGGKKLPELARGLVKVGKEFNNGLNGKDKPEEGTAVKEMK